MNAWASFRRTLAQRGWRPALRNVVRRLRFAASETSAKASSRTGSHPFDEATGMDTAGLIHGHELASGHPHDLYSVAYYGTAPSLFHAVVKQWGEAPADYTFVDVGCGKGRVILLASQMGFKECVGVELNAALATIAQRNAEQWQRGVSPIRIVCADATEFAFPTGKCVVYLFNPFTAEVLERLLERIAVVFADRPGELDLLYVNAECSEVLEARPEFALLWKMPVRMSPEDAAADLLFLADDTGKKAYGEPGQGACSGWRWTGKR